MGNAQVHAAVGAQVAPQFITIPPPLFRSFQREVAARLLPAHTSRLLLPSAARASAKVLPASDGGGVLGAQAGLLDRKGARVQSADTVEVALLTRSTLVHCCPALNSMVLRRQ
jgi:hypothetical protein